jgi:cell division protein FtsI (penicillin-binding protein 3)
MRLGRPGRRLSIGFGVVCVMLLVVTGRLVQLQGVGVSDYASAANQEHVRKEPLHAARGSIVDRNGVVLAYTADAKDVIADPSLINCTYPNAVKDQCHAQDRLPLALKLSELTGAATDKILAGLALKTRYAVIAQAVAPVQAQQVDALNINGIFVQPTTERLYPGGTTASNIVGLVHSDGTGAAGIEAKFNTLLRGKDGMYTYDLTATGGVNPAGTSRRTAAVDGSTVHLTISQDLQFVVQRDLNAAVKKLRAKSGNVVVLDVKSGTVLALAGSETAKFDPQDPSTWPDKSSDSAIQAPYEPGSVSKVLTFSAALQKGLITPTSVLTVPDHLKINDVTIHDDWYHNPLHMTATGIIARSSNIGTLKIAQKLGPKSFMDFARAYGLGQPTGIELPGEDSGTLIPQSQWSSSTYANFPIGQGYYITPLQLASVYQTIANDGVRIPPRVVSEVSNPDGTVVATKQPTGIRVTSAATARTMRTMLEAVMLKGGTAAESKLKDYRIAGKTGTAQQIVNGHYSRSVYWDSFAGIVPADNPQFVVAVMINAPADGLFGAQTAAPLFHDIAAYQVQHAGILPSDTKAPLVPLQVK